LTTPPAATESANAETQPAAIWRLAWPVTLSNATVPLVGLVDTAIMGRLPDPAFIGGGSAAVTTGPGSWPPSR